uniref:Uncharacterized protein n=1 Tax=Myoviridae sp. ctuID12 TaxID=2826707 RepID=A0A8S5QKB1_9CAUD|nr:MAG TPA: hypothetical protein [Myoviridae sp. ctuID12]
MIDFLRANTWCSQEEYKWGMTVPQVRLASMDFTHIEYLDDDKRYANEKTRNLSNATIIRGADDLKNVNDLGIPIV